MCILVMGNTHSRSALTSYAANPLAIIDPRFCAAHPARLVVKYNTGLPEGSGTLVADDTTGATVLAADLAPFFASGSKSEVTDAYGTPVCTLQADGEGGYTVTAAADGGYEKPKTVMQVGVKHAPRRKKRFALVADIPGRGLLYVKAGRVQRGDRAVVAKVYSGHPKAGGLLLARVTHGHAEVLARATVEADVAPGVDLAAVAVLCIIAVDVEKRLSVWKKQ
ncbi:hypothetical protein H9P43_009862 [Blastocladiella emersonii ATCC 22665]|nr:hypothetical protein H9P43_009862 [Blastocladiella emersonii ATCC 22665]